MLFEKVDTADIQNKGFILLDSLFKQNGWHIVKNEMNHISYSKLGQETDIFSIKIEKKYINVSIPIKNSNYQFTTTFTDYFQASEYLENRFLDFIHETKMKED
jgi:hypothetical protein